MLPGKILFITFVLPVWTYLMYIGISTSKVFLVLERAVRKGTLSLILIQ
jgi:hypothetical protein